jgi:hypothetical protein
MSTPWGAGIRARDWRGAERPRKRRNPRKARFFAEQKMRPNEVLKKPLTSVNSFWVEALYTHLNTYALILERKQCPTAAAPKTCREAGSDGNRQPPAQTPLLRYCGGTSPRLWALLPRLDAERENIAVSEPKGRLASPKKEAPETGLGGGYLLRQSMPIYQSRIPKQHFLTNLSLTIEL